MNTLATVAPTAMLMPAHTDLRVSHVRRAGLDLFYVVNEGEGQIEGVLRIPAVGAVEAWDLLRGTRRVVPATSVGDGSDLPLRLPRRESLILAIDPRGQPLTTAAEKTPSASQDIPASAWTISTPDGHDCPGLAVGDWSQQAGWELFSGTLVYRTRIDLPAAGGRLDLGEVGQIAEYRLDGQVIGVSLWAPYSLPLPAGCAGTHLLEIHITNSMANEYEGAQLPAGLIGPVHLHTPQNT